MSSMMGDDVSITLTGYEWSDGLFISALTTYSLHKETLGTVPELARYPMEEWWRVASRLPTNLLIKLLARFDRVDRNSKGDFHMLKFVLMFMPDSVHLAELHSFG